VLDTSHAIHSLFKEVTLTKCFSKGLNLFVSIIHPNFEELFAILENTLLEEL
jgi:hypothetical protein